MGGKQLTQRFLLSLFIMFSLMGLSHAQAAPTIVEFTTSQTKPLNAGKTFNIQVNFSEGVSVTGTPTIAATIGSTTRHFTFKSMTRNSLRFGYEIVDGDNDEDGITLTGFELNGGSIQSASGVDADLTIHNVRGLSDVQSVIIDTIAPTVLYIRPKVPSGDGANVEFDVKFSEDVYNLDRPAFVINAANLISHDSIVTGSGSEYTYKFIYLIGPSQVYLKLRQYFELADRAGNRPVPFDSGEIYTVNALNTLTISPKGGQPVRYAGDTSNWQFVVADGILASGSLSVTIDGVVHSATPFGAAFNVPVPALDAGTYTASVEYSGDAYTNPVSTTATLIIEKRTPSISLTASRTAISPAENVSFTVTVTNTHDFNGNVSFYDGTTYIGTAQLLNGVASFPTSGLSLGQHNITARIDGDVNNHSVTSSALVVTVQNNSPIVFTPNGGTLPDAQDNSPYSATISASGGMGNKTFEKTGGDLPLGLFLDSNTGLISGTVGSVFDGSYNFTLTATDEIGQSASASFTIYVHSQLISVYPQNRTLPNATIGQPYNAVISTSGGTGSVTLTLTGALPLGLSFDQSTGAISGTVDPQAEVENYGLSVLARDTVNVTSSAQFEIMVVRANPTIDANRTINAVVGAPNNVDLTAGASGGPFTGAAVVSVSPSHAGTASIVRGEFAQASGPSTLGWYLKFVPRPGYSGTVVVRYTLSNASGPSSVGTITYTMLGYDPDEEAAKINDLVHGFVSARQSMLSSSIKRPGLLERRRMVRSSETITTSLTPTEDGVNASFSTSMAQMHAARDQADGIVDTYHSPFNIWIDGSFLLHNREDNGNKWGSFAMLNLGADFLLNEKALVGLSLHYDRMSDPTKDDAELVGNGWLAGPYASFEIGNGVFFDTSILYGGSVNDIETAVWEGDFTTRRWMLEASVSGEWQLDNLTTLTPKLRTLYFNEMVEDYTVRNELGDELTIDGFESEQFRISLGAEIAKSFTLDSGAVIKPKLETTAGLSGLDGSGAFGSMRAGFEFETSNLWLIDAGLMYNFDSNGQHSIGAKVKADRRF